MATTVITAFNNFLKDTVNLDFENSKKARSSRNWLVGQIKSFPEDNENFPTIYNDKNIFFGSFARKTKKRPLDDIDLMICLNADGCTGDFSEKSSEINITVHNENSPLYKLCYKDTSILNSKRVINKFISELGGVDQYDKADINRCGEAATLKLKSYDWNFDIVPCFFTTEDDLGKTYYLIPDGEGGWKKTDPRIDRDRVTNMNQANEGNILNIIRIMKYWNRRPTMPSMGSYLLENMILDYYDSQTNSASSFVDIEIPKILEYIRDHIYTYVSDPKGIQGNINTLSDEEKGKIWSKANSDKEKAENARQNEQDDDHKSSIGKWSEIFGSEFPEYG